MTSQRITMNDILANVKKSLEKEQAKKPTRYEDFQPASDAVDITPPLNRVILPVIRRVMPSIIANEIISVQPMTGPAGQIHTLRVKYENEDTEGNDGSTD